MSDDAETARSDDETTNAIEADDGERGAIQKVLDGIERRALGHHPVLVGIPEDELARHLTDLEGGQFIARVVQGPSNPALAQNPGAPSTPSAVERLPWQDGREPLPRLRARLVRALLDATGPNGDDMATRIERCLTIDELRSLVEPSAAIVEAVGGHHARARFLERLGGAGQ